MEVSIIVAIAENGVIGRDGQLPWRLSDDLRRFKELTMNHTVVLGRKTWESIGRPLPGRQMVVVSSQGHCASDDVHFVSDFADAMQLAKHGSQDQVFVMGGAQIYRQALPQAKRLYITKVHATVDGDVFFPEIDFSGWKLVESREGFASAVNDYDFRFEIYERLEVCCDVKNGIIQGARRKFPVRMGLLWRRAIHFISRRGVGRAGARRPETV